MLGWWAIAIVRVGAMASRPSLENSCLIPLWVSCLIPQPLALKCFRGVQIVGEHTATNACSSWCLQEMWLSKVKYRDIPRNKSRDKQLCSSWSWTLLNIPDQITMWTMSGVVGHAMVCSGPQPCGPVASGYRRMPPDQAGLFITRVFYLYRLYS